MSLDALLGLIASYSPEQIIKTLRELIAYENKEKDCICRALALICKNINDWYNELYGTYSDEISRQILGKEISEEWINKIVKLTGREQRQEAARDSISYLKRIEQDHEKLGRQGISGRFRQQEWAKEIDIEKVKSLENSIHEFCDEAVGRKKEELIRLIRDDTYYTPAERIVTWLNSLGSLKTNMIREEIVDIINDIHCETTSLR